MLMPWAAKRAVAVIAAMGSAGVLGVPSTGTGLAATQAHAYASMGVSTAAVTPDVMARTRNVDGREAPLFTSSGIISLPPGTLVDVSCYYIGNPPAPYAGDGFQDHVTRVSGHPSVTGHIPDPYINFGLNATPPEVGVPLC
jgi:hypothetical protein